MLTDVAARVSIELVDDTLENRKQAVELSTNLGLQISEKSDYALLVSNKGLMLSDNRTNIHPLLIDFSANSPYARRLGSSGVNQLLAKAVGIKHGLRPEVVDCTAGIGRDAYFLAAIGCSVTMLERSAVIAALIYDALHRSKKTDLIAEADGYEALTNLTLVNADAGQFLKSDPCTAEVAYIDTMFPERKKSALVKGEMQLLQDFLEDTDQCEKLVAIALEAGYPKVVAKRPLNWRWNIPAIVNHSITGKTIRYDVFLN